MHGSIENIRNYNSPTESFNRSIICAPIKYKHCNTGSITHLFDIRISWLLQSQHKNEIAGSDIELKNRGEVLIESR